MHGRSRSQAYPPRACILLTSSRPPRARSSSTTCGCYHARQFAQGAAMVAFTFAWPQRTQQILRLQYTIEAACCGAVRPSHHRRGLRPAQECCWICCCNKRTRPAFLASGHYKSTLRNGWSQGMAAHSRKRATRTVAKGMATIAQNGLEQWSPTYFRKCMHACKGLHCHTVQCKVGCAPGNGVHKGEWYASRCRRK